MCGKPFRSGAALSTVNRVNKLIPAAIAFALLLFASADAHAKRGIAIINTGEDVVEIADIKDDARAEVESTTGPGAKVGLMYSRFGLFWLDLWRWDAKWVLVQGDNVWEIDEEQATALADGELSKPFTMTVPPGLIVVLLLVVGFVVFAVFLKDDEDDEIDEESQDAEAASV